MRDFRWYNGKKVRFCYMDAINNGISVALFCLYTIIVAFRLREGIDYRRKCLDEGNKGSLWLVYCGLVVFLYSNGL